MVVTAFHFTSISITVSFERGISFKAPSLALAASLLRAPYGPSDPRYKPTAAWSPSERYQSMLAGAPKGVLVARKKIADMSDHMAAWQPCVLLLVF